MWSIRNLREILRGLTIREVAQKISKIDEFAWGKKLCIFCEKSPQKHHVHTEND